MYVKGGCLIVVIIHNAPHNADIKCASEPFADCGRCQDRLHSEDQARHHEHHGKVSLLNNRCDICRKQRLYKVSSKPASTKVDYHYNFRITKAKLSYLGTKFTHYLWENFRNNFQKICLCKRFDKYHVCLSSASRNTFSYFLQATVRVQWKTLPLLGEHLLHRPTSVDPLVSSHQRHPIIIKTCTRADCNTM